MATTANIQHQGTWVVPKNLVKTIPSAIDESLLSTTKSMDELCNHLTYSIKVEEVLRLPRYWARTYTKKLWFPFLNHRIIKQEDTKFFSEWWNGVIKKDRVSSKFTSKKQTNSQNEKFYTSYFHGGTKTKLARNDVRSWQIWISEANKNLYNRDSVIFHLGGGICLLGTSDKIKELIDLLEYLYSRKDKDYDVNDAAYLRKKLDTSLPYTSDDDIDTTELEEQLKALDDLNNDVISKYLQETKNRSFVRQVENVLKNRNGNAKETFEIPTFEQSISYENYIHIDQIKVGLIQNQKSILELLRNTIGVVGLHNPENFVASDIDTQKFDSIDSIFGNLKVFKNILKDNGVLRVQRAKLLGNGVVPQTCSIVTRDILGILLDEKCLELDYLPIDIHSMADLESKLLYQKKKDISLTLASTYSSAIPNYENVTEEEIISTFDNTNPFRFPIGQRWATPTVGDSNNVQLTRALINYDKEKVVGTDTKGKPITKRIFVDRQRSSLSGNIFVEYHTFNKQEATQGDLRVYPITPYCINLNWTDALMGLTTGWTNPLFGWDWQKGVGIQYVEPTKQKVTTEYLTKRRGNYK